ncbi:MAG: ShlB/FhaC/HecB family hemolysin secretion/activation protein [Sphingomonadaceae bacterium]
MKTGLANRFVRLCALGAGWLAPLLLVSADAPAEAQDFRQSMPRLLEPAPPVVEPPAEGPRAPEDATPIIASLKAVRFVPGTEWLPHPAETGPVEIVGLPILDTPAFRARAEADLGKPASIASLNALARSAVAAYRAAGRPLVDVAVPEQDVTDGTVAFVVREFVAGDVRIEGNRHFATERLRSMIRLEPGQTIDQNRLVDDLNRIAENPFRRVDLLYRRGEAPLTTDVVVRVNDRLPLRVYGSFDNNGTPAAGRERLSAGFNWGNAFGADGQLAYQYTTSKDLFEDRGGLDPRFQAHSLTLVQPISRHANLILFGTYQRTAPDLGPFVGLTGEAWQLSPRLAFRILSRPDARAQLTFGYDFKQTDNDLLFGGATISTDSTQIHQLVADLTLSKLWKAGLFAISTTIHASPGGIGSRNTDSAFQPGPGKVGTPFARATYAYWRTTVTQTTPLFGPKAELVTRVTGQLATGNLLPSEQLSIAGPGLVRAYDPNAVLGSNGLMVTQEFWGPAFPLLDRGPRGDSLRFGGFIDAGMAGNPDRLPGEPKVQRTASVGAMARYRLGPAVDLRVDYGTQLRKAPGAARRGDRAFVSLTIGF